MFNTADFYLGSEVAYRRERAARDWKAANNRRRLERSWPPRGGWKRRLRLPAQPHLPLPKQRRGEAVVA